MFLNDEVEIKNWLMKNINGLMLKDETIDDFINRNYYFTNENNQLIVNTNKTITIFLTKGVRELPIKFGTINGGFDIFAYDLENLNGFPKVINGFFRYKQNQLNKESIKSWGIEEINGTIDLSNSDCALENLDFLKNVKFKDIKLTGLNLENMYSLNDSNKESSIFKNNKFDFEDILLLNNLITFEKHTNYKYLNYDNYIKFNEILESLNQSYDNYLNEFNNELDLKTN